MKISASFRDENAQDLCKIRLRLNSREKGSLSKIQHLNILKVHNELVDTAPAPRAPRQRQVLTAGALPW